MRPSDTIDNPITENQDSSLPYLPSSKRHRTYHGEDRRSAVLDQGLFPRVPKVSAPIRDDLSPSQNAPNSNLKPPSAT